MRKAWNLFPVIAFAIFALFLLAALPAADSEYAVDSDQPAAVHMYAALNVAPFRPVPTPDRPSESPGAGNVSDISGLEFSNSLRSGGAADHVTGVGPHTFA